MRKSFYNKTAVSSMDLAAIIGSPGVAELSAWLTVSAATPSRLG